MKKYGLLLFALPLMVFVFSCKKDKILKPSSPSYNYFPTQYGRFVSYTVDSIVHQPDISGNDSITHYHFELKDAIDSTFPDLEGKKRQVLLQYYRDTVDTNWNLRNVWSQLLTSSGAYRYEDNIPYHKLAFPINTSIQWNGNDMNTNDAEMYSYQNIHTSMTLNNITFDSTITVLQIDELNFIERIYGEEIYAENIGMIYHERDNLNFNGIGQISSGTEYKMTVEDYGPR